MWITNKYLRLIGKVNKFYFICMPLALWYVCTYWCKVLYLFSKDIEVKELLKAHIMTILGMHGIWESLERFLGFWHHHYKYTQKDILGYLQQLWTLVFVSIEFMIFYAFPINLMEIFLSDSSRCTMESPSC